MTCTWNTTVLSSEAEAFQVLTDLQGKQWLCRGHSGRHGSLIPSIDRDEHLKNLSRPEKLALERQSIDIFRTTARFFAAQGEQDALRNDIATLMVLRHYGVPTRLLDWSMSPFVAAYFSVHHNDEEDGEIWSFDRLFYERVGGGQWKRWPQTTTDLSGNGDKVKGELTAFTVEEPPDWFVCGFYPTGFPRQDAQFGAYTLTARFNRDHADAIANLLDDATRHHRYIVPNNLKPKLRTLLREKHGIWRGSLFPDSAGAAETARSAFEAAMTNFQPF